MNRSVLTIADLKIAGPFEVFAVNLGHYVYSWLDRSAPVVPDDIGALPVLGLRVIKSDTTSVMYIDSEVK